MGNDIMAYRAAIGSFHPHCKTSKTKNTYKEGEIFFLALIILFLATVKNLAYVFTVSAFLLAISTDIHPNPDLLPIQM